MTQEQKKSISDHLGRKALLVKMMKIENEFMKGQVDIPNVNKSYSDVIRVCERSTTELNKFAKSGDKLTDYMDDERVLTMYSILQFIGNLPQEQLTVIETEFYKTKQQP